MSSRKSKMISQLEPFDYCSFSWLLWFVVVVVRLCGETREEETENNMVARRAPRMTARTSEIPSSGLEHK